MPTPTTVIQEEGIEGGIVERRKWDGNDFNIVENSIVVATTDADLLAVILAEETTVAEQNAIDESDRIYTEISENLSVTMQTAGLLVVQATAEGIKNQLQAQTGFRIIRSGA